MICKNVDISFSAASGVCFHWTWSDPTSANIQSSALPGSTASPPYSLRFRLPYKLGRICCRLGQSRSDASEAWSCREARSSSCCSLKVVTLPLNSRRCSTQSRSLWWSLSNHQGRCWSNFTLTSCTPLLPWSSVNLHPWTTMLIFWDPASFFFLPSPSCWSSYDRQRPTSHHWSRSRDSGLWRKQKCPLIFWWIANANLFRRCSCVWSDIGSSVSYPPLMFCESCRTCWDWLVSSRDPWSLGTSWCLILHCWWFPAVLPAP